MPTRRNAFGFLLFRKRSARVVIFTHISGFGHIAGSYATKSARAWYERNNPTFKMVPSLASSGYGKLREGRAHQEERLRVPARESAFGLQGLGFGVWGLNPPCPPGETPSGSCARKSVQRVGFRVWGLGLGVWGLGFGIWSLGFRV